MAYDEGVLGSSENVRDVVEESREQRSSEMTTPEERKAALDGIIAEVTIRLGLSREEIQGGSR